MWWLLTLVTGIVILAQCITISVFGYLVGVVISFAILLYLFKFGDSAIKLEKYEYFLLLLMSLYSWLTLTIMIVLAILNREGE